MSTDKEQTRLPGSAKAAQVNGFERDDERYDYVLVQNKIPGVQLNPRDQAYYRSIGFVVANTDEQVTGHEALTLMARPKEIGDRIKAEHSARNNAIYGKPEDQNAAAMLAGDGSLVRDTQGFSLKDMGAELPTAGELDEQERLAIAE